LGYYDNAAKWWTATHAHCYFKLVHKNAVNVVKFHPSDKIFASGSLDGKVIISTALI